MKNTKKNIALAIVALLISINGIMTVFAAFPRIMTGGGDNILDPGETLSGTEEWGDSAVYTHGYLQFTVDASADVAGRDITFTYDPLNTSGPNSSNVSININGPGSDYCHVANYSGYDPVSCVLSNATGNGTYTIDVYHNNGSPCDHVVPSDQPTCDAGDFFSTMDAYAEPAPVIYDLSVTNPQNPPSVDLPDQWNSSSYTITGVPEGATLYAQLTNVVGVKQMSLWDEPAGLVYEYTTDDRIEITNTQLGTAGFYTLQITNTSPTNDDFTADLELGYETPSEIPVYNGNNFIFTAAAPSSRDYVVTVPALPADADPTNLVVTVTNTGAPDVELYVNEGSPVTESGDTCADTAGGLEATCTVPVLTVGTDYYIRIKNLASGSAGELNASVYYLNDALANNTDLTGINSTPQGEPTEIMYWSIDVPAGQTSLDITATCTNDTTDLYLLMNVPGSTFGTYPIVGSSDYESDANGTGNSPDCDETISITPDAGGGTYVIGLSTLYSPLTDATLNATYSGGGGAVPEFSDYMIIMTIIIAVALMAKKLPNIQGAPMTRV